jgi:hypothetical protein
MPKQSKPEFCYLCGKELAGDINDDHVPPRHFYAQELRRAHNPNLLTIPTHTSCNSSYQKDEEYFVHTMIPLARDSYSGQAIFRNVLAAYTKGEKRGLGARVLGEFDPRPSGLYLPDGRVVKRYDAVRVNRVVWKVVRGLFFHREGKVIPEDTPRNIKVVDPKVPPPATFRALADRPTLGDYPGVLDYKYAQIHEANNLHYWALLLWDRIILLVALHDPECECEKCAEPEQPVSQRCSRQSARESNSNSQ